MARRSFGSSPSRTYGTGSIGIAVSSSFSGAGEASSSIVVDTGQRKDGSSVCGGKISPR
jgi:hypothetical protein